MDETTPRERFAAIQRRQHGAAAVRQAKDVGLDPKLVHNWVARGRLRGLLPGVVAGNAVPDSWQLRAMAAVLWAGRDAVLAQRSAARLLGMDVPRRGDDRLHLLVADRTFEPREGIVVHRTGQLTEADVTQVGPIPTTNASRTTIDLSPSMTPAQLRRTLSAAVRSGETDAAVLRLMLDRLGRVRGRRMLTTLLDELSPLEPSCRSWAESRFLRLTTQAGIPPTAMNHPVPAADGTTRYLDAVYLPERLPVEIDSRQAHGTLLDWHDDTRRESRIHLAGSWRPFVRISAWDLERQPSLVLDELRLALTVARTRG